MAISDAIRATGIATERKPAVFTSERTQEVATRGGGRGLKGAGVYGTSYDGATVFRVESSRGVA